MTFNFVTESPLRKTVMTFWFFKKSFLNDLFKFIYLFILKRKKKKGKQNQACFPKNKRGKTGFIQFSQDHDNRENFMVWVKAMSQLLLLNINDVSEVKYYFTISIFGTSAHFELQTHLMSNAVDWMIRSLFGFKNSKKLSLSWKKISAANLSSEIMCLVWEIFLMHETFTRCLCIWCIKAFTAWGSYNIGFQRFELMSVFTDS